jgi:cell division transport system ATP-binding protein
MIRFTNVTKTYPRTGTAVAGVSLHVAKGEFVFFTGPSGAGKSTLLKMVYFEERPSEGEVRVGGTSSKDASRGDVARLRRKLGIVFQDFRLLDDRTVAANIAFALEVIGAPTGSITVKVGRLLERVGLASKANAFPRELSGGEQQRVAIARALVNDPFVLVADEPTGNLDDRATRGVFQLLRDINASGTAVMMATHNLELIRRCDYRTVEINRGQVVFDSREQSAELPPARGRAR